MSDAFVQVFPDSTGKKVDTSELTVGGNTVERQRVAIGDSSAAGQFAAVTSAGALTVDGSAVTQPISGSVVAVPGAPTSSSWLHAFGSLSASGVTSLIAGVTGQTIRVYKINVIVSGATNVSFLDSTPTTLSANYILTANGSSYTDGGTGEPLWITGAGKGFEVDSSSAVTLNWEIWYSQS